MRKLTPVARQEIETLVKVYHEQGRFTGSVLAATDGVAVYAGGVGLANVEWGMPNAADTRFRIGSITKQFTAAIVLQLVAEDKLEPNVPLTRYLPSYGQTGDRVTLHHLLTHSSGIPSYTDNPDFWNDDRTTFKVDEFVSKYCSGDLDFEPGTEYRYSNSGYFLLGAIIEAVTGRGYAEELQSRIFGPLKMTGSGYDTHEAIIEKRAIGYTPTYDGLINSEMLAMSSPFAAGALYSTVEDLARWDEALRTGEVLKPHEHQLMFSPHIETPAGHYGYGWVLERKQAGPDEVDIVHHGGGINGFGAAFLRVPSEKHAVVALGNVEGGEAHGLARHVLGLLRGGTVETPKPTGLVQLKEVLDADGPAAALERYRRMAADSSGEFLPGPWELNRLGSELTNAGRADEATVILEALVEIDDQEVWHQVALSEACEKAANDEGQVRALAKALAMAPTNGFIRGRLHRSLAKES